MKMGKMLKSILPLVALAMVLAGVMVGCEEETPVSPTTSPLSEPVSPVAQPEVAQSPLPTPGAALPGPAFAIDTPVPDARTLTGQGPAGIPILVVDVSMTGEELGQGYIDDEGNFEIALYKPLIEGHRVGLMAGADEPMSPDEASAYLQQLYPWKGEGAMDLPHVGLILASAVVRP